MTSVAASQDPAAQPASSVLNYAALRALTSSGFGTVFVEGIVASGDGGQGAFIYVASDTTSADNGGTIIAPTGTLTGRWYRAINHGRIDSAWFAGLPANTDQHAALQAWLNAASAAGLQPYLTPGLLPYLCSASLTLPVGVIVEGANKFTSVITFTHTGAGLVSTSPLNSDTVVYNGVRDIGLYNNNPLNTDGLFVNTGGTYVTILDCEFRFGKFGVILNQSEIVAIERCIIQGQLATGAGIWLVNGADYTPGADGEFTNNITVRECQFNEGTTTYCVADDGGTIHNFEDNNFNGGNYYGRFAGVLNLTFRGNECESATIDGLLFTNTSAYSATGVGVNECVIIEGNEMTAANAAAHCCFFSNGSAFTIKNNFFSCGTNVQLFGIANLTSLDLGVNVMGGTSPLMFPASDGIYFETFITTLVAGENDDVALPFKFQIVNYGFYLTFVVKAPTAIMNITGLVAGYFGQRVTIYNTCGDTITFNNNSSSSAVGNRLRLSSGADTAVATGSSITFLYEQFNGKWCQLNG